MKKLCNKCYAFSGNETSPSGAFAYCKERQCETLEEDPFNSFVMALMQRDGKMLDTFKIPKSCPFVLEMTWLQ